MTFEQGLGMFSFSMICFFAGAMVAWFIINNIDKE